MACRLVFLISLAVFLAIVVTQAESRTKKVIIHVPYKVRKIKHTHTVYKTVHHHHSHHGHLDHHDHLEHLDDLEHVLPPAEEHEHFHHMHIVDEPPVPARTKPIPSVAIPGFLPDAPLDLSLDLSDLPRDLPVKPKRHGIPLYR